MITSYHWRLLILSLACFFLAHLALGLVTALVAPLAIRAAEKLRPRWAALLMLVMRLMPSMASVLIVLGVGVPAYLWLEPDKDLEWLSLRCLLLAALGGLVWALSIGRGIHAVVSSLRYRRHCARIAAKAMLAGEREPVWVLDCQSPSLAITGLFRSRIVISRELSDTLSPEQLSAALRHEGAHRRSLDNFKRLLLILAPGLLPVWNPFGAIEKAWCRFVEWAADDVAVAGNLDSSLALSSALVLAARLGLTPSPQPLMTSFASETGDLGQRVNRMLRSPLAPIPKRTWIPCTISLMMASGVAAAAVHSPRAYSTMHAFLEHLTR